MEQSSKELARLWPYPRHSRFEKRLRECAAAWFKKKRARTDTKRRYILAKWDDWPKNIIRAQVVDYINSIRDKRAGEVPFAAAVVQKRAGVAAREAPVAVEHEYVVQRFRYDGFEFFYGPGVILEAGHRGAFGVR